MTRTSPGRSAVLQRVATPARGACGCRVARPARSCLRPRGEGYCERQYLRRDSARPAAAIISLLLAAAAGTGVPQASHLSSHLRAVLPPARTAPVRDECSHFLVHDADGNVAPLLCAHGEVNTLAWQAYARGWVGHGPFISSTTMGLGPHATYRQVIAAMCVDMAKVYGTVPLTLSSEVLAAAYYGWHFSQDQKPGGLFETELSRYANEGETANTKTDLRPSG